MGNTGAKAQFPRSESGQCSQPVAGPQVPAAKAEARPEPAEEELRGEDQLCQKGQPAVQGTQGIGPGTQQDPCQNAAQKPVPYQSGIHRSSPRFRPGSG